MVQLWCAGPWQVRIGEHGILAVHAPVIVCMYLRRYTLLRQRRTCLVFGGDTWSVVDEVPFIRNKFADEEQEILLIDIWTRNPAL